MRLLLTIIIVAMSTFSFYGQERAMVWYFGDHAGLNFSNGDPQILTDGSMVAEAGCTSICDTSGSLLFYTNGRKVWNRNHEQMPAGDSLKGSQVLNQNSIITPLPGSESIYYLFTISDLDTIRGFNYSIIDMNLDNGFGDLIEKNITIKTNVLEKVTAIEHCNGNDYWIIVHGHGNDFYSYLLNEDSLFSEPVQSTVGSTPKADIGYMKASPRSDKITLPINDEELLAEVFEFNNLTGIVSDPIKVMSRVDQTYCYGLAFSPNGNLLYVSTRGMNYAVWQYNLQEDSEIEFNENSIQVSSGNNFAMQLAPNGKIYIASENRPHINTINNPNVMGEGCNYESEAISFTQATSLMGLPNFVQSWCYQPDIAVENTCLGDTTFLSFNEIATTDSCRWNIFDSTGNQITSFGNFYNSYEFNSSGKYYTQLSLYHCGVTDVIEDTLEVSPFPVSGLISDTSICNNCNLMLDAGPGFDSYLWNDSSTNQFLEVYYPGTYSVEISKNGCSTTDSTNIRETLPELYLPNAFTPNGDGFNDEFGVINPGNVTSFSMTIFCRRGTQVFHTEDIYFGWNGVFKGELCYRGTYVWFITYGYFNDLGHPVLASRKGIVTLIR